MAANQDVRKATLVDKLATEAVARVPAAAADDMERFIRQYFAFVAPDDIIYTVPETLVGGALSLFEFGAQRSPGTPKVRLYNPTTQGQGWSLEHTVLEIINDDMPFLVDSVIAELARVERNIHLLIHPVMKVRRGAGGERIAILDKAEGGNTAVDTVSESYMHLEFDQETEEKELETLRTSIERVLGQVRVVVSDFKAMKQQLTKGIDEVEEVARPLPREEVAEAKAFLEWLDDDNFIFMGYRRYRFSTEEGRDYLQIDPASGLGILREVRAESMQRSKTPFTAEFSQYARRHEPLIITKANSRSVVHKPVVIDRVSIKRFDSEGRLTGEDRFLGLFTSAAYSRSVRDIPLLRRKARRVLERSGIAPGSHDGKALIEILETLPRDELFQMSEDELFDMSLGILGLQDRQRVGFFTRTDVFERFVSCLIYLPRDRYNSEFREKAADVLEKTLQGTIIGVQANITDSPLARVQFIIKTTPGAIPPIDHRRIEALMAEASRSWTDRVLDALVLTHGEEESLDAHRRYRNAFPAAYSERFSASTAATDIAIVDEVARSGSLKLYLYRREEARPNEVRTKLFHTGPVALSQIMPLLENMGLRVQSETTFDVKPEGTNTSVRIRDFSLIAPGDEFDLDALKGKFQETFLRVWRGEVEDDGFNRLVLGAGLEWHEVVVLRAYCKYLRQTGVTLSEAYMQQTLARNVVLTRLLMELFNTLFKPGLEEQERNWAFTLRAQMEEALDAVSNPDEDRILRRYLNLIESTLRTNYFQRDSNDQRKPYVSFKFDSRQVEGLPAPRPLFEIFVYSPRMEGIHLRGGKVARGGIRWSDRREDFRTEILGLMKAQTVKNAVIVPVGAKGGFVVKQPPANGTREEMLNEGIACYKFLIRGMLDLTDNLAGDAVVPPPDILRRDSDDSYLVVAADKGTATFSDIANSLSAEYSFWLGDAFASGGSAGYDHKKMGITARGGWEAVKRHFHELGKDVQTEEFTTVGVGDMSGDVFGNAMLLSRKTKLIGAFNHLHIFVDPDPDPEVSFDERQRLFDLPRSSWSDYNGSLLSSGGAVFERSAKSITISDQVQQLFDLSQKTITPNDLIQAILRARADLMWLGGIGTYVKASDETHAQVSDRTNDLVRVNARELRVKVVGEGANLGFTQRARVEFALVGGTGKINTDAIDNSAGVDCSDHEVNIKILVDDAIARGELTAQDRLALLADMTDEVARLVLRDNYQQTQVMSITAALGPTGLDQQMRFIRKLERAGKLDRALEGLPDDETVAERQAQKLGLTRPEIAVLLAYSKISLYQELLESNLPDDPLLVEDLILYFPKQIREAYRPAIQRHRLRREIIATFVSNTMINRVTPTFVSRMSDETGRSGSDVARAYAIVRDSFDLRTTWKALERLDATLPAALQTEMMIEVGRLVERTILWLLRNATTNLDITAHVQEFRPRIAAIAENMDEILSPAALGALRERETKNVQLGLPTFLARRMASLDIMASAGDIVRIAREGSDVIDVGRVYFQLGSRFDIERLRVSANGLVAETPWQKEAVAVVIDDLYNYQGVLASRVLGSANGERSTQLVDRWLSSRAPMVSRIDQLMTEMRAAPVTDLSMLTVVTRQLRALVES